jgi:hypothetical protein
MSTWYAPARVMSRSRTITAVVALCLGGAGVLGYLRWQDAEDERRAGEARRDERERRDREQEERREQALAELREESAGLIPPMLGEIALGMSKDELRAERAATRPRLDAADRDPMGLTWLEERLPNGSQVVYGFDAESRLAQLQIMSVLPSGEALTAHMTAMIETYGRPTGIWDCPNTGGVPTRRFTWRRAETALADILLIYGDRISQTLYIAPEGIIGASLRHASCTPVRSEEQLVSFPTTTVEQIQRTQKQP